MSVLVPVGPLPRLRPNHPRPSLLAVPVSVMSETTDADLEALPAPRRPWRKLTLLVMTITLVGSLLLTFALRFVHNPFRFHSFTPSGS